MSRSMERCYAYYKLEGTNVHVLCTDLEVLWNAVHCSQIQDWTLVGAYDVQLTKDREASEREHMLAGLKRIVGDSGAR